MTITITGKAGEGKKCVANICRHALETFGIMTSLDNVPFIEWDIAQSFMDDLQVSISITEVEEE